MKFSLFQCPKKPESWHLPVIFVAGIMIGLASMMLILHFRIPQIGNTPQIPPVQDAEQQSPYQQIATSTNAGTQPLADTIADLHGSWVEPEELSREEIRDIFFQSSTNTVFVERALGQSKIAGECDSVIDRMWSVGKVASQDFNGFNIFYVGVEGRCGMGDVYTDFKFLIQDPLHPERGVYLLIPNLGSYYSYTRDGESSSDPFYRVVHIVAGMFTDLEMPRVVQMENGKSLAFLLAEDELVPLFVRKESKMIARTISGELIYERPDIKLNGFLQQPRSYIGIFDRIGRFREYESFVNVDVYASSSSPYFNAYIPNKDIEWDSSVPATKSDIVYSPLMKMGCGDGGANVVDIDPSTIIKAATYINGELLYIPKEFLQNRATLSAQEDWRIETKQLYDQWMSFSTSGKTPERFFELNPVPYFFWKNAFGNWIQYTSDQVLPPTECGKPVIYLYPEEKMDVSVKLPSFINVTLSDPAYPSNGWDVTANPNGDLVSHADGKTYGSLYWEGTGVNYKTPATGFVVKGSEVQSFLASTLPKYGLNEKEAKEFMDFWVPKMQPVPYAQISFLTDDWSKAAPLFVSPRPQTSIRIFMDWKPLSVPVSIQAPNIVTPKRHGFTLVEWGGTLYK